MGICNLGLCLCPQCLIPKDHFLNMGVHQDLSQCVSLTCVDDVHQHSCLKAACEAIYERNNTVDGVAIERLLKDNSLVPMTVSVPFFICGWC